MGPDNRRLLVATVVSIVVLLFWQLKFAPKKVEGAEQAVPGAGPPAPAVVEGGGAPGAPAAAAQAPAVPSDAPEELIRLDGSDFEAVVSTHGGGIASLTMKGTKYMEEKAGKTVAIDLIRWPPGTPESLLVRPLTLVPSRENGGTGNGWTDPAARAPMRVVAKDAKQVVLEGQAGSLRVRKTFRVTGKPHELALDVEVEGATGQGGAALLVPGIVPEDAKSGGLTSAPSMDVFRPVCRGGDKTERFDVSGDKEPPKVPGAVSFAGLEMHYFVAAVMPATVEGTCEFVRGPVPRSGLVAVEFPLQAGPAKRSFTIYAGPKDLDALRSYERGLDSAIDYGAVANLFAVFARGLLYVMLWVESFTHSWGVAIIILTFLVKAVLFPLTYKSTQSMNAMKRLQPEIEKLKEKHKNDREKLNLATMQLYQKHKVNPLGGCLPMLLQMPIWFALYAALQTSVELYREPFLWMKDLTVHDPYFILPVLMGISSFAMQKLSPQPVADSTQAKMMLYFFPAFFTFIMLWVPGGLTLYILVNNLLTIVQQQALANRSTATA